MPHYLTFHIVCSAIRLSLNWEISKTHSGSPTSVCAMGLNIGRQCHPHTKMHSWTQTKSFWSATVLGTPAAQGHCMMRLKPANQVIETILYRACYLIISLLTLILKKCFCAGRIGCVWLSVGFFCVCVCVCVRERGVFVWVFVWMGYVLEPPLAMIYDPYLLQQ